MPLPKTRDVGKTMEKLNQEHPEWSRKKKIAVSLNVAREAGAKIPKKRKKR